MIVRTRTFFIRQFESGAQFVDWSLALVLLPLRDLGFVLGILLVVSGFLLFFLGRTNTLEWTPLFSLLSLSKTSAEFCLESLPELKAELLPSELFR